MGFKEKTCDHLATLLHIKEAKKYECALCVKTGDVWVHLRTCQTCGVTLCCDSSPNKHARKHAQQEDHQVITSAEPGERWMYCYTHNISKKY